MNSPTQLQLLLVEDNDGDADLISEYLEENGTDYAITRVRRLDEACHRLKNRTTNVVLLDLHLPDGLGVESVKTLRRVSSEAPLVVLTGSDDQSLALSCIDAGAQDFLSKSQLGPILLKRTIGYAITRLREAQLRELQTTLESYRRLSSSSTTTVTASLAGGGPFRERHPQLFSELVLQYVGLVDSYLESLLTLEAKPRPTMERIVTALGDRSAGPRDLLEVHVAALDRTVQGANPERARACAVEGRLLALEMMGLLVEYYRVGHRRVFQEGPYS